MQKQCGFSTVDQILQEAHERQFEISLLAEQEAWKLKERIVTSAKEKIDEQFKTRIKNLQIQSRVVANASVNHYRMLKIRQKYELCEKIFSQIQHRILIFSTNQTHKNQYMYFLLTSIVEGIVRMSEDKLFIRCLERDQAYLKEIIPLCIQSYNYYMEMQVGRSYEIQLSLANNMKLQPRQNFHVSLLKSEEEKVCMGGVVLADESGDVSFKATLDCRLNILKQLCLPDIRAAIWQNQNNINIKKNDGNIK